VQFVRGNFWAPGKPSLTCMTRRPGWSPGVPCEPRRGSTAPPRDDLPRCPPQIAATLEKAIETQEPVLLAATGPADPVGADLTKTPRALKLGELTTTLSDVLTPGWQTRPTPPPMPG